MQNRANQILNVQCTVDRASDIATRFISRLRVREGKNAVYQASRQCGLSPAVVKRFVQPSRRPKTISVETWRRLVGGYARYLERQLAEMEEEAERVRAIAGADDGTVQDLLRKTEALAADIRRLL